MNNHTRGFLNTSMSNLTSPLHDPDDRSHDFESRRSKGAQLLIGDSDFDAEVHLLAIGESC